MVTGGLSLHETIAEARDSEIEETLYEEKSALPRFRQMHSSCFPRFVPFGLYQISSPVAGSELSAVWEKRPIRSHSREQRGSCLTKKGRIARAGVAPRAGIATINTFHHVAKQNGGGGGGEGDGGEDDGSSRWRSVRRKSEREREILRVSARRSQRSRKFPLWRKLEWFHRSRSTPLVRSLFLSPAAPVEILSTLVKIELAF